MVNLNKFTMPAMFANLQITSTLNRWSIDVSGQPAGHAICADEPSSFAVQTVHAVEFLQMIFLPLCRFGKL